MRRLQDDTSDWRTDAKANLEAESNLRASEEPLKSQPPPDSERTYPEVQRDQRAVDSAIRRLCAVAHSEFMGWSLFRHEDAIRVLLDHETFSSTVSQRFPFRTPWIARNTRHSATLLSGIFSSTRVRAFEPVLRDITAKLARAYEQGQHHATTPFGQSGHQSN